MSLPYATPSQALTTAQELVKTQYWEADRGGGWSQGSKEKGETREEAAAVKVIYPKLKSTAVGATANAK